MDFIQNVDYDSITFMREAIRLNSALTEEGKRAPYGSNVNGSLRQNAQELLFSGKYKEVTLAFDINADDFFRFAAEWCKKGAKIKKMTSSLLFL